MTIRYSKRLTPKSKNSIYLCQSHTYSIPLLFMKLRLVLFLFSIWFVFSIQASPKREVRAAWITTAYRLDWPQTLAKDKASMIRQQKELTQLLDHLKASNFNTVLFQVRGRGDANYFSKWEPMSAALSGQANKSPGYDALKFAIEECHKRGMECHAWLVAVPSGSVKTHQALGKNSPTRKEPSNFIKYKGGWYINPASPTAKDYLAKLVEDIVTNYDVDGIHFDYMRYPDGAKKSFPDSRDFKKYGNGVNLEQWRRDNITKMLSHSYETVKKVKPWVKVSTCPIGKHSDTNNYPSRGWNAYDVVYQDVFKWMELGIVDQIYPMMYFQGNNYYPFALDWKENSNGRHVISGLGIYFLDPREGNWSIDEIKRQLNFTRDNQLEGQAYFRAEFLVKDTQKTYSHLKSSFYKEPALIPAMPWLNNTQPNQPENLKVLFSHDTAQLSWKRNESDQKECTYIIYKSDKFPVDTKNPENILESYVQGNQFVYTPYNTSEIYNYYAVTSIDRYGNESEATQLESKNGIEILE